MSTLLVNGIRYALENSMGYGTASAGLISILVMYLVLSRPGRGSIIRNIRGPPSPSWIFGNMLQLMLSPTYGDYEFDWQKLYGPVYRLKGCFGVRRFPLSKSILNSPHFAFGPTLENFLYLLFDDKSLVRVNDVDHKRFRSAMNVGFSAAAVRNYLPVFDKAARTLTEQLEESSSVSIDISPLLCHATLNAISEAVLGYSTTDLGQDFVSNYFQLVGLASNQSRLQILADAFGARLPRWIWRAAIHLPTQTFNTIRTATRLANELGSKVVLEKLDAKQQGLETNTDVFGRLLDEVPSGTTRNSLTSAEVASQTSIFLLAAQETTANMVAFGLLELARVPELQEKLRAEIHSSHENARPSSIAYDSMPLLNAFIKEILRMYPGEPLADRIAVYDTLIPLADSLTTSTGECISQIPVRKGQSVFLGIASYQRLKSRWGEDPHTFRPSRWLDGTVYKGEAIGPYANLMTFLGGPRVCLGWRFAIFEMQVFICELVGKFSFALPQDRPVRIGFATGLLPIMSNGKKGAPLCIERVL